jgi:peroxiredoxin
MSYFNYPKSQKSNPMPFILLGGFILGIVLGWFLFMEQPSPVSQAPSRTPIFRAAASITSTPFPAKAVEITPKVNIQSIAKVGQPAPDFSLKTIDGEEIRLSTLKGKAVLINMWASWCPPCRDEMPAIQAAYKKYKDKGLVVLGIDFTVQDNLPDVKAFIQELGLTFPILLDETGEVSAGLYGMRALPTSNFVDTEGVIQRIQVGAMTTEKLEEYLAEILLK